jgi:ring-1,2-phenylacetyl-CoA epoxidase subunit PaaA
VSTFEHVPGFEAYVAGGGQVRPTDPMPEGYRQEVVRLVGFQALAEIVGATLFSEWLDRVPSLDAKLVLTAKCQDEMGHAQVLMRVVEDLGVDRDRIVDDYLRGRAKLLNIFHYRADTWPELAIAALLQNSAAIVQFQSLVRGSYQPYVRALRKIMREESFHYHRALHLTTLIWTRGRPAHRRELEEGLRKWFPLVLAYFGPHDRDAPPRDNVRYRVKVDRNDVVRDAWLDRIVPVLEGAGLPSPDPRLARTGSGAWTFTEPDWAEVKRVIAGDGPVSRERRALIERRFVHRRRLRAALPAA